MHISIKNTKLIFIESTSLLASTYIDWYVDICMDVCSYSLQDLVTLVSQLLMADVTMIFQIICI